MMHQPVLSPSMMCTPQWTDASALLDKLAKLGAGYLHMDAMDGAFVQNLMLGTDSIGKSPYANSIRGICIDATSLTLVCVDKGGTPLEKLPGLTGREQAMVKLWKRHHAEPQARELLALAQQMNEPFLRRTGSTISSEWTLPKLLEIRDVDPKAYAKIDLAFDLCEYLTWRLTGQLIRSSGSMCYKGLWAQDLSFPSDACLNRLRPGFAEEYKHLLRGEVRVPGQRAGYLKPELCAAYGMPQDIAVAVGTLDGHTTQVIHNPLRNFRHAKPKGRALLKVHQLHKRQ